MPKIFKRFFYLVFLFLFFYGCSPEPKEADLLLPVNFTSVPGGFVLTSSHNDNIEIRIQGTPRMIEKVSKKNIEYHVDIFTDLEFDPAGASVSIEPGGYLIPVIKERISLNPAIEILSITPSYLSVKLEKKLTKRFDITVPYAGKPATGFFALDAGTNPATVELTGAASIINRIEQLKTKPVDLTDTKEDFKKKVPLDLDESLILSPSKKIITASVQVRRQMITKKIEGIPIHAINSKRESNISPSKISIEVKGPYDILSDQKIEKKLFSFIDLQDLKPGVYARYAYIDVPLGLVMTGANPEA